MKWIRSLAFLLPLLIFTKSASAHCPLCTVGIAVAAGGAAWFGVSNIVIGVFVGAFAVSTGWWVSKRIKRQYVPFQTAGVVLFSFVATMVPLMSTLVSNYPLSICMMGEYGSLLNTTYVVDLFLAGGVIGGGIVLTTPWLSRKITTLRNGKMVPYQGVALTLVLLIVLGTILGLVI